MPRKRTSAMSPQEFHALREASGYTVDGWAILLDCGSQSVRNMEAGTAGIGRQMGMLALVMAHPVVRGLLPEIFRNKDEILRKEREKNT